MSNRIIFGDYATVINPRQHENILNVSSTTG
jgi:hypothetical protein